MFGGIGGACFVCVLFCGCRGLVLYCLGVWCGVGVVCVVGL